MAISTQTVYNVFSANKNPRNYEAITIDASQTLVPGSVIGKIGVAAGTAEAGGSNTGDGVASAFALAAGGPAKIGDFVATCIEAVTNSGRFNVVDPDGLMIGQITVAVSDEVVFTGGGVTFTIADGATDFAVGDTFTFPVAAGSGRGVILNTASTDGSQGWRGVCVESITTGAGESQKTMIVGTGDFHSQGLVFGGSTVYTDVIDDAKSKGAYIDVSYEDENVEIG